MIDEADLKTSFPFSRFVRGVGSFNVSFAVGGANSASDIGLVHFPSS